MMLIGHEKQWNFFRARYESGQLAHAYLFTGKEGIGKKKFAKEFVKLINCRSEKKPCQKCANCLMIEKNGFPDLLMISEANKKDSVFGDGGEIKIKQVREAQNFLSYKSYYGSFKSLIVDDAEKMSQESQSCFLKTFEEPKGNTVLFLITSKPDILLGTIGSRCQTVKFFRPSNLPENQDKLEKEKTILKDLTSVVSLNLPEKFKYIKSINLKEQDALEILGVFQKYLRYLLLRKIGVIPEKKEADLYNQFPLKKDYTILKIKKIINLVEDINNRLIFTNVNPKLALEVLLIEI